MKKILLATDKHFWQKDAGDKNRTASLIDALAWSCEVHVVFLGKLEQKELRVAKRYGNIELHVSSSSMGRQSKRPLAKSVKTFLAKHILHKLIEKDNREKIKSLLGLQRADPTLQDFYSESHKIFFDEIYNKIKPDYILVICIHLSYLVRSSKPSLSSETIRIIDTHDVMHKRYLDFQRAGCSHWLKISKEEEIQALQNFDVILAIQDQEADIFQKMLPDKNVITVRHSYQLRKSSFRSEPPVVTLSYVAGGGVANRVALAEFLACVWPNLSRKYGGSLRFIIAGNICSQFNQSQNLDGVQFVGYVNDVNTIYQQTDIFVNPVSLGAGLKIKNVEALCQGLPLVTTSKGAEGMEQGSNSAFLVRDTPHEMGSAIASLIDDHSFRKQLSEKAYQFAQHNFTREAVYENFMCFLGIQI